jgi:hypothetical protein
MNERIRELAIEAGYMEDGFGIGHWDMPECKKFAELIVRECANVAHTCIDDEWFDVGGAILEHFGVA